MKRALLAFSLLLAFPTFAATSYGSGNISDAFTATLVAVNDQICYSNVALPAKLATVQWTVVTAGSGGITVQISKDYGTNSIQGVPLSVLTSAVSANPSTAQWANNGPVVGSYETPIPNGTTNFCILYQTGGTATTITLAPGKPYVPGSVSATISDLTEGSIGAGISTSSTPIDISGWSAVTVIGISPTTQAVAVRSIDDAGAALGNTITMAATSNGVITFSRAGGHTVINNVSAGALVGVALVARRIAAYLPAGGTVSTGRIIVQGYR